MRIGVDSTKFPGAADLTAAAIVERAAELGLEGVFFRSVLELSPTLDVGRMRATVDRARELGLHVEAGIGKVNPFSTPEAPRIRALGGGDYLRALTMMIEAAAAAGVHEVWSALCNFQFDLAGTGLYAFDRFRTDVDWSEQLAATTAFLRRLAPVLRAQGSHVNVETHEEITSFELVRMVEEVGPDAMGITFDTANVVVRGESVSAAARRVAPYVRSTHVRDVALIRMPGGLVRYLLPVGDGIVDWPAVLSALSPADPMLSIEGIISSRAGMPVPLFDGRWAAGHPDEVPAERDELLRLADAYEDRARRGEALDAAALRGPVPKDEPREFVVRSAAALRALRSASVPEKVEESK